MIIGLMILAGLAVYLIITIMVVMIAVKRAHKKGKPGWKAGCLALGVMYLLLFWDLIPMRIAHQYYCSVESGFNLYKSLEQWQQGNPNVLSSLVPSKNMPAEMANGRIRHTLNQRFAWDRYITGKFLGIRKQNDQIVDTETGEVLAQYTDFDSGQNQHEPKRFRDFKMWLWTESCDGDKNLREHFYQFEEEIESIGSSK